MKNRKGQALIVIVIIMAVVMAIFVNALTTELHSHSLSETEIYQREQALYLAEIGVNRMIFNINGGDTYNDGDYITGTVTGIGSYKSIYHTPDDSGYGGSAYIESIGTVGQFSRKIFASIQAGGGNRDAFKYCLYTTQGGSDGISSDSYFTNNIYGDAYRYNSFSTSSVPHPDPNYYNKNYAEKYIVKTGNNPTYRIKNKDLGKVLYIHTTKPNATLTVSFVNIYDESYNLSIITDAKNVKFTKMGPANGDDTNWYGAENSKDNNLVYPILVHLGTGTATFKFDETYDGGTTLYLHGFLYTKGGIDTEYISNWFYGDSYGVIDGEVIEENPAGKLGGPYGDTRINYVTDYYNNPPPHFIVPGENTELIPGGFREEY